MTTHTTNSSRHPAETFSDREYQVQGVTSVVTGLREGGRGQMLCACGTGKTKMAIWIAERVNTHGGIVVIVAPTVGLVDQTLRAWQHTHHDHRALAVCSDDSVHEDSFTHTADLLEPVTTDPDVVAAWLRLPNDSAIRLIVGTHVSAHVIGEGLQKAATTADLLVIDEAHRSAGGPGKHTALVHDDDVLPAVRRLYATATAKIDLGGRRTTTAAADRRARAHPTPDADRPSLSMDDESVFGPVLFRYPFSRAIAEGWLDDYRLAVIGVTKAEVLALLRETARTAAPRSPVLSQHTAMVHTAIARAAADLGLRRVLAFCPRVDDATEFARTFPHTLSALPPTVQPSRRLYADVVHGGMNTAQRKTVLDRLAEPPEDGWTVISNAKCLSEGIDVPTVDGIVFTAPKRSTIDIIQAMGRALRRDPNGTGIATILVPILLPDDPGEIDGQVDPGAFDVLWEVVRALRAHDDLFGAALDDCRASDYQDTRVLGRMTFTLPEQYKDGEFLQHLTVRLVKSATDQWWDGYARLAAHYAEYGHTRISETVLAEDGFKLGAWVKACRVAYRQNRLAPDRITALEKVDFVFDPLQAQADQRWEKGLAVARGFYAENGHLRPPNGFRRNGITLGNWLTRYRREAQRGELAKDRKKLLTGMGMDWRGVPTWDDRARELKEFHTRHGRFATPSDTAPEAARLYRMQSRLRMARKKDRLSQALIEELDQLGFEWDTAAATWRTGLAAAAAFREQHGHLCPGRQSVIDGVNVYEWTVNRRQDHKAGRLTDAEFAALDELGMIWGSVDETAWNTAFAAASEFHATYGHLRIPERFTYTDHRGKRADLKQWIHRQRDFHRDGSLTTERFKKLDALGLDWRPSQSRWETNLAALQEFHAQYGHLNVPLGHRNTPDGPNLANVLTNLRVRKRAGDLDNERIEVLEALGIDWNPGRGGNRIRKTY
ncbi:DEAD/DEAH box helicase [Saccharopolyspora shandongensis]|uniref:DEAD/DEAH box helicase n=1 Tax=Saccharopolyspora shandongensis TaxID=418495 RepID=UPI0033E823DF